MAKRIKAPAPRKTRRNPLAKTLATPKYRPRVVKRVGVYKRRVKHPKAPEES